MFLTECPRDAMQGWPEIIPTGQKIRYLNALMRVNYTTLDCGSFVSPKAIPQMADTREVLAEIDKTQSGTRLSVIVANISGAEQAASHPAVDILGFPFSISETFQQRNTQKSREMAFEQIKEIKTLAAEAGKQLNIYFSMAFGNPYEEPWSEQMIYDWASRFSDLGIENILLSDTTGVATPPQIQHLFAYISPLFPKIHFGAHFHNKVEDSQSKIQAAYDAGCRHFDSAIRGIGGCPFAKNELVGNMPTEQLINFMARNNLENPLNMLNFETAWNVAKDIFHF